jgi:hypothetical protein
VPSSSQPRPGPPRTECCPPEQHRSGPAPADLPSAEPLWTLHDEPTPAQPEPAPTLDSYYGTCNGKTAYARETSAGSWQVKVYDPTNRLAGHDGWLMLGTGWPTLPDARTAAGLS